MQIIKKPADMAAILLKLVGYYLEWIRNRWVVAVLICILVIAAAIIIVVLLCQPHKGNYTNAWYVRRGNEQVLQQREIHTLYSLPLLGVLTVNGIFGA